MADIRSKKVSVEILERIAFSIVTLTRSTFVPSVKTDGELLCSSLTRSDKGNDATNRESKFYKVVASCFPSTFPYPILTFACNLLTTLVSNKSIYWKVI